MIIGHVTTVTTVILPDVGTQDFKGLYERWYGDEGRYLAEDGLLPEGDDLINNLFVYVVTESYVGNETEYISGDDTGVEFNNNNN